MNPCELLVLCAREAFSREACPRRPEPSETMLDPLQVDAYDREGGADGCLEPVYEFNSRRVSRLVPPGGAVVELGSGSGRFLAYLARRRPDLELLGIERSPAMLARARRCVLEDGLQERVTFREGDMRSFSDVLPARVDALISVFALHHLPDACSLERCLKSISEVRRDQGCAVWLFDHARPRARETSEAFPQVFTPESAATFRRDSRNSLRAAFSLHELTQTLASAGLGECRHDRSRLLPLYQAHSLPSTRARPERGREDWQRPHLSLRARLQALCLRGLFALGRSCESDLCGRESTSYTFENPARGKLERSRTDVRRAS